MIVDYDGIDIIRDTFPKEKLVLFKGSFDLFHYAHLKLLQQLSAMGDIFVVEVKSDDDIKQKKGNTRPIINENERVEIVDNIKCVEFTILANKREHTPLVDELISKYPKDENKLLRDGYLIEQLKPDCICTTDEVAVPESIMEFCNRLNIEIIVVPEFSKVHTSDIINKIKNC